MAEQRIEAATNALAACPDRDAVADLLRRHGCRGAGRGPYSCPVAVYLRTVGGDARPAVLHWETELASGIRWRHPSPVGLFIMAFDRGEYADLADAAGGDSGAKGAK